MRFERLLADLPKDIDTLAVEAGAENVKSVARLISDWRSGAERFEKPGEILIAAFDEATLVGIGGATIETHAPDGHRAFRMRRYYVRQSWRRRGVGRALAARVIEHVLETCDLLTVNAGVPGAAPFWEALGFERVADPTRTHELTKNRPR